MDSDTIGAIVMFVIGALLLISVPFLVIYELKKENKK